MKMIQLGQNRVSALGFGAMRLPQINGEIDYTEGFEMIDRAMAAGINYFDTAWFYHGGASEVFLRKALVERYPRESYYLADKLPPWECESAEFALNERFMVQLERLGVDYIDYYLLHGINLPSWEKSKEMGLDKLLIDLKEKGLIKHICFSFHDNAESLEKILSETPDFWTFAQIMYSYYDTALHNGNDVYEVAAKYHVPVVVMEPVRGGSLAHFNNDIGKIFKDAAPEASIASWAMRYAGTPENVAVVLSGMSNMEQLNDNINSFTNFSPLDSTEIAVINKAMDTLKGFKLSGCTNCKYCVSSCPVEINIPSILGGYDSYIQFGTTWELKEAYLKNTVAEKQASSCIDCGACMQKCPQKLLIPSLIKTAHITALEI